VITRDHDNLDTRRPAFDHGVRDGRAGRVDHGHEADEPQTGCGEVHHVSIKTEAGRELLSRQKQISKTCETATKINPNRLHCAENRTRLA